jgi:hypothetical protein
MGPIWGVRIRPSLPQDVTLKLRLTLRLVYGGRGGCVGLSPGCRLYDVKSSVCVVYWNTLYNVDWVWVLVVGCTPLNRVYVLLIGTACIMGRVWVRWLKKESWNRVEIDWSILILSGVWSFQILSRVLWQSARGIESKQWYPVHWFVSILSGV